MTTRRKEKCNESHYCYFQKKEVAAAYRRGPRRYTPRGELIVTGAFARDLLTLPKCRLQKKWELGAEKIGSLVEKMAETPIPKTLWDSVQETKQKLAEAKDPWMEEPAGCIEKYGSRLLPEEMARLEEIRRKKGFPVY